jgi:uncharacterized protein (DUF2267 family)
MHYQEFVNRVNERIREDMPGETEFAIQATLATLGECASGKEAESLASRLPVELSAQVRSGNYAEEAKSFSLAEFYRRIAEREGALFIEGSSLRTRAVMTALFEIFTSGELATIERLLPEGFESLSNAVVPERETGGLTRFS